MTLFDTLQEKKIRSKYIIQYTNTQGLQIFLMKKCRSFFVKEAFIERLNKCIDAVKPIVHKVFLFASTKYFYGFLLSGLNVFICILRGNFVFLFVRYSFCALQNTVACISALFHIFTASQVC